MKIFDLYTQKLNPACDSLWQKPRRLCHLSYAEECWFESHPVGHTPLDKFMGVLSDQLQLSFHYTNHCIQATGMTLLNESGFEAHHICTVSSNKNEATIRNYAVKCPDSKKHDMSNTLASALVPAKIAKPAEKTPESTV